MKNPIKRILAATLCAAVTAVNFSIGEIKAPVTVTANAVEAADGTNETEPSNSIFNERDDSTVGNSTAEDITILQTVRNSIPILSARRMAGISSANALKRTVSRISAKNMSSLAVIDQIYVTATEGSEEQEFSYWTKRDDGVSEPVVVGYEEDYAFLMPSRDTTLTAVYEGSKIKEGTAYIESVTVHDTNKISFVSVVSVPNGATMERAGIVACMEGDLNEAHSAPSIDYARFKRYNDTTCKDYTTFKYTWTKGSVGTNDVWCVCAYLVYSDKDGEYTVYGNMVKANLAGIITENS